MIDSPNQQPTDSALLAEIRDALVSLRDVQAAGLSARWLSIEAAAIYSGLSAKSIRRLLSAGKLAAHRPVGGRVVVDRLALDTLIAGSVRGGMARSGRGIRPRAAGVVR